VAFYGAALLRLSEGAEAGYGGGDDGEGAVDLFGGGEAGEGEAEAGAGFGGGEAHGERTCEGSVAPDWQAAPKLAAMPCMSRAMRRASASMPSKRRLVVLGERWVGGAVDVGVGDGGEQAGSRRSRRGELWRVRRVRRPSRCVICG
jgi:hypothetical protein